MVDKKMINEIERNIINERYSEMTESEIDFIYDLLDKERPNKIVEVGVAAGGTTAAILEHIRNYDNKCCMYSIDKSYKYYRNTSLDTGFITKKYINKEDRNNHEFLLGKYAPEFFGYLKGDIDFLILDTVHSLPGELLDFLAFLPYLTNGAIVILHDTCLNHRSHNSVGFATQLLLDVVSGEKIFDLGIDDGVPNIGAFRITDETRKNIEDVFRALLITWNYKIDKNEIDVYFNEYKKHYSEHNLKIFETAVSLNNNTIDLYKTNKRESLVEAINFVKDITKYKVYIYGNGYFGKMIYNFFRDVGVQSEGFIVSDNQVIHNNQETVRLSDYAKCREEDDIIIIGVFYNTSFEIEHNLISAGIDNYLRVPDCFYDMV